MIAFLAYIAAGFIPGNNDEVNDYAYPITKKEDVRLTPVKRPFLPVEHKVIIERNIFGSSGPSSAKENLQRKGSKTSLSAIEERFRLCATVTGDSQIACAIIEDLRSRRQVIYKRGEFIEGAKIERIDRNKIALFREGRPEVLNLHIKHDITAPIDRDEEPVVAQKKDTTRSVDNILTFDGGISKRASTTQVPAIEVFLEKIELSPHIISGQEKGLCITGLDDLSFAIHIGLENGDIIQNINGQVLTNKQKAFQVLKKARSQSPISVQLLRDHRNVNISFETK
jgi:type II secretion system protein C